MGQSCSGNFAQPGFWYFLQTPGFFWIYLVFTNQKYAKWRMNFLVGISYDDHKFSLNMASRSTVRQSQTYSLPSGKK